MRSMSSRLQLWGASLLFCAAVTAAALEFDMAYQTKCIMEEINANVLVVGDYAGFRKGDKSPVPLRVKVSCYPFKTTCLVVLTTADVKQAVGTRSKGKYYIRENSCGRRTVCLYIEARGRLQSMFHYQGCVTPCCPSFPSSSPIHVDPTVHQTIL
jgi:hypothetical protein